MSGGLLVVGAALCSALAAEKEGRSGGPPPLVVDKNAPLLLDAPAKPAEKPKGPVADNSACHVCHTNYQEEQFAVVHAKANVSCAKCHGQSLDHRNDEDNITPPDVIFPAAKIETLCKDCHEEHNAPAVKVIARWQQRCPAKTNPKDIICTDCHGDHRLKTRTVRWDKDTRKLITRPPEKPKS